jgi:malate synthase A
MGGMAAQIPIKNDSQATAAAFAKVRADKEREVRDGYDGTWVAHPDLVPVAKEVFDRLMPQPNQTDRVRLHVRVLRDDLLKIHKGTKTEAGVRLNIRSAYNISMPGCAGAARCRSTISWKTRRPPRSPARKFGNGSNTAPCSRAA